MIQKFSTFLKFLKKSHLCFADEVCFKKFQAIYSKVLLPYLSFPCSARVYPFISNQTNLMYHACSFIKISRCEKKGHQIGKLAEKQKLICLSPQQRPSHHAIGYQPFKKNFKGHQKFISFNFTAFVREATLLFQIEELFSTLIFSKRTFCK